MRLGAFAAAAAVLWAAAATAETPAVNVVVTTWKNDPRLVFQWRREVQFEVVEGADDWRVRFNEKGPIDRKGLAKAAAFRPRLVDEGEGETVILSLPDGKRLRPARSGASIVIDVVPLPPGQKPKAGAPEAARAASAERSAGLPPAAGKPTPLKPGAESFPARTAAAAETVPPKTQLAEAMASPAAGAPWPPAEKPADAKAQTEAASPGVSTTAAQHPASPPRPSEKPHPPGTAKVAETPAPQAAIPRNAPPARSAEPQVMRVRHASSEDATVLRFEAPRPLAAAVFRRGAKLWIAFDQAFAADLSEPRQAGVALEPLGHPSAAVFRLSLPDGVNPSLTRAGAVWALELKPQPLRPEVPVPVETRPGAAPARILFGLRQAASPIELSDPETGERLLVVPNAEVGQGLSRTLAFVDFRTVPTLQGMALRSHVEGLSARVTAEGVEVSSPAGLVLSTEADRLARRKVQRLFDFAAWGSGGIDHLAKRRALLATAAAAEPEARTAPRLELARFLVADGYAIEAVGVLAAIERDDGGAFGEPAVRALRGAAAFLAGDREMAAKELSAKPLDTNAETALWRGAVQASRGEWQGAAREFAAGASELTNLPKRLRHRFSLMAAEAAIAAGPREAARPLLETVLLDKPATATRAQALLLAGRLKKSADDVEGAIAIWDEVLGLGDRPSQARARLEKTVALVESGRLPRAEAIEALDALRFDWRGDDVEFTALRRLAELRIKEGDWRGAFDALRQAQTNFPDHPEAKAAARQAQEAVTDLFEGTAGDELPPLRALALFEQLRELVPAGPRGDGIMTKLVDRLVAVDLLDRAAGVLEAQAKGRSGAAKAAAMTRLAQVRLLDRKPDAALAALDESEKEASAELAAERARLRAKTLAELGRTADGLAAIKSDETPEAERVRADLHWRAKDWRAAAASLSRLAQPPGSDGVLDDDGAKTVLNWATALTLAGDTQGLAAVQETYGPAMQKSPQKSSWRAVTGGEAKKLSALK